MAFYLCCVQMFMKAIAYLIPPYKVSLYINTILLTILFIASGYTIHQLDMTMYTKWLEYISPARWVITLLAAKEFSPEAVQSNLLATCKNKQVNLNVNILTSKSLASALRYISVERLLDMLASLSSLFHQCFFVCLMGCEVLKVLSNFYFHITDSTSRYHSSSVMSNTKWYTDSFECWIDEI